MLEVYERLGLHCHEPVAETVILEHDQRNKGRLRLESEAGTEVRLFLERGKPLLVGEFLKAECGKIVQVKGAEEPVAHASCDDWQTFSRACYHLGNRHVKVQVGERWLRIKPDYVLEEMVHLLGLVVSHEHAVFEPESGAYSQTGHSHGHSHGHDHGHEH